MGTFPIISAIDTNYFPKGKILRYRPDAGVLRRDRPDVANSGNAEDLEYITEKQEPAENVKNTGLQISVIGFTGGSTLFDTCRSQSQVAKGAGITEYIETAWSLRNANRPTNNIRCKNPPA